VIRFRVLGSVEIEFAGRAEPLAGPKQRAVLSALLLSPNAAVSTCRLCDVLWNGAPPTSANANLRNYVAGLRRVLHTAGEHPRLCTGQDGYMLEVRTDEFDLAQFNALAADGRAALDVGDYALAVQQFQRALALWRGPAFADVPHLGALQIAAQHADEARTAVIEDCSEAQLALGRHTELLGPLRTLVAEHPLRERLWRQLMLAQYRSGLPAEALDSYRRARAVLSEDLGIEPGPELRRLHVAMLERDPALDARSPRHRPVASLWPICQLPPDIADFTGRTVVLDAVEAVLAPGRTVPIVTLTGLPGAGKTTLAVRLAHALRSVFTDGQLYLALGGGSAKPREPAALLGDLLRALGIKGCAIPDSVSERSALMRSLLSDRRVLVVLDDATDVSQIEPLLPGTAGCAVLVTSRNRLSGLPGGHLVDVGLLPEPDAREMLGRIVGPRRLTAEPAATARVLTRCGGLPLAIRVAGAKLAGQHALPVRWLADRIGDEHDALRELVVGDLAIRGSVALSYRGLGSTAARAFRALGILPLSEFTGWAVAALLGVPDTEGAVSDLLHANMLQVVGVGPAASPRYGVHDLLRSCAEEQCHADDAPDWRRAAAGRVLDGYLTLARAALNGISGTSGMSAAVVGGNDTGVPRWSPGPDAVASARTEAVEWLEVERKNLIAMAEFAITEGFDERAGAITSVVDDVCHLRSWWDDWEHVAGVALAAASARADPVALATAQGSLARVRCARGHADDASALFTAAIEQLAALGEDHRAAALRVYRSFWINDLGFSELAESDATSAAAVMRRFGDRDGLVLALRGLGRSLTDQRRCGEAVTVIEDALRIAADLDTPLTAADLTLSLAIAETNRGRLAAAATHAQTALATYRLLGHRPGVAYALLAQVRCGGTLVGPVGAFPKLATMMGLFRDLGDCRGAAHTVIELGRAYATLGDLTRALHYLTKAHDAFRRLHIARWAARAQDEKARVLARLGRRETASAGHPA
jgi:DNA-binding SARP family transcriptional activator